MVRKCMCLISQFDFPRAAPQPKHSNANKTNKGQFRCKFLSRKWRQPAKQTHAKETEKVIDVCVFDAWTKVAKGILLMEQFEISW